jgi:hypothetical protein
MSFTDGGKLAVFPTAWIKECIATYTREHGKAPKLLVINSDDLIDYKLNLSIHDAVGLGIKITHGDYLKKGEIDLAMGIDGKELD